MCEYMQTNGVYNGIQIHRNWLWNNDIQKLSTYGVYSVHKMYSKGMEWEFSIENTTNSALMVSMDESTKQPKNKKTGTDPFNQFSGLVIHNTFFFRNYDNYECEVLYTVNIGVYCSSIYCT